MPSTLGTNLIDTLVPLVDQIRDGINGMAGVRQYDVFLVRRCWTGDRRGEGVYTQISSVLITPRPLLTYATIQNGKIQFELMPHGKDEVGDVALQEVSLAYSLDDLTGGAIAENEEFFYKFVHVQGQGLSDMYFVPDAKPIADREKTIGWIINLRRVEVVV